MPKYLQYYPDDAIPIIIIQGTNAQENIDLIRSSQPTWWWLHLDIVPSSHIIIQADKLDSDIINFAAHICIHSVSKKKQDKALWVQNNIRQFTIITTRISNLIYQGNDLDTGEVQFKSNSRKKLLKHNIIYNPIITQRKISSPKK